MKYIITTGGPVFDGLVCSPSRKQERSRTGGVWLNVRVTERGRVHRIWFGDSEVKEWSP